MRDGVHAAVLVMAALISVPVFSVEVTPKAEDLDSTGVRVAERLIGMSDQPFKNNILWMMQGGTVIEGVQRNALLTQCRELKEMDPDALLADPVRRAAIKDASFDFMSGQTYLTHANKKGIAPPDAATLSSLKLRGVRQALGALSAEQKKSLEAWLDSEEGLRAMSVHRVVQSLSLVSNMATDLGSGRAQRHPWLALNAELEHHSLGAPFRTALKSVLGDKARELYEQTVSMQALAYGQLDDLRDSIEMKRERLTSEFLRRIPQAHSKAYLAFVNSPWGKQLVRGVEDASIAIWVMPVGPKKLEPKPMDQRLEKQIEDLSLFAASMPPSAYFGYRPELTCQGLK
ncbi:MAG: hypothetical protein C4K60_12985 [Ideonella sp. MAG2]|nr:MAG: hypothetical protein C4K60_12985 [Ideonella sp. MAG2]